MNQITLIRPAEPSDAKDIADIYNPYIEHTTITYEFEKVTPDIMRQRMDKVMEKYPWLVYEKDGKAAGYVYASTFKERAAYQWDCEVSVYVSNEYQHEGIGTALYEVLINIVKQMGICNLYAVLDYPNIASETMHKKFGFINVGVFEDVAYKMGAWRSVLYMVKNIHKNPSQICYDWRRFI